MSLQPYFNNTSVAPFSPFRGTQDWGMTNYDPFSNSMMQDPMIQRTMRSARNATQGLQPILSADILDRGDKYEVFTGKYIQYKLMHYTDIQSYSSFYYIDLPGVSKADLDITIANGTMTIKGERKHRVEEDDMFSGIHRVERTYGKCSRTLQLPTNCDTEHADCSFENGELKVSFPKLAGTSTSKHLNIK